MVIDALAPLLNGGSRIHPWQSINGAPVEGKHFLPIHPTPMSSFAHNYVLSPYCIAFAVGLLQSNLHDHLVREVSSSLFNYINFP